MKNGAAQKVPFNLVHARTGNRIAFIDKKMGQVEISRANEKEKIGKNRIQSFSKTFLSPTAYSGESDHANDIAFINLGICAGALDARKENGKKSAKHEEEALREDRQQRAQQRLFSGADLVCASAPGNSHSAPQPGPNAYQRPFLQLADFHTTQLALLRTRK
jgi:hypothetical protein